MLSGAPLSKTAWLAGLAWSTALAVSSSAYGARVVHGPLGGGVVSYGDAWLQGAGCGKLPPLLPRAEQPAIG